MTSSGGSPAEESALAVEEVWSAVRSGARTVVVDSPPGAGKSTLVRDISNRLVAKGLQIPIVVQTNNQADDMVVALAGRPDHGGVRLRVHRMHGADWQATDEMSSIPSLTTSTKLERQNVDVIVSTASKWATLADPKPWKIAIIDEAYQMTSAALIPIGAMSQSILAVGDPGQVNPFTTVDEAQFRAMTLPTIDSAATTLLKTQSDAVHLTLPVSWRLRPEATDLVSDAFYQIPFVAGSAPGDRNLIASNHLVAAPARSLIHRLELSGWGYLELPDRVMPVNDPEVAAAIADVVMDLLRAGIHLDERGRAPYPLSADRIAVGAAHTSQVDAVRQALAQRSEVRGLHAPQVRVDTANRLQGQEFDLTIVWHPLSGRLDATRFHLDAGRLCVLLSRHRFGCVVVGRAGIEDQLVATPAEQEYFPGSDLLTDGWLAHGKVMERMTRHRVQWRT